MNALVEYPAFWRFVVLPLALTAMILLAIAVIGWAAITGPIDTNPREVLCVLVGFAVGGVVGLLRGWNARGER